MQRAIKHILRREFHASFAARLAVNGHTSTRDFSDVKVTYIDSLHGPMTVTGQSGDNLLEVAHKHNIDLEGACGGELACSTCHLIFSPSWYEKTLTECPKSEEEDDMLDLAWGLTDTSRLGCQCVLSAELDGLECHIPDETDSMLDNSP
jgi:2Fe-2S ferredoxin